MANTKSDKEIDEISFDEIESNKESIKQDDNAIKTEDNRDNDKDQTKKLSFKDRLKKIKDKAIEYKDKSIEYGANKVAHSKLIIKDDKELDQFIEKSKNNTIVTKEGVEKTFSKRVIIVIGDSQDQFFQDFLLTLPILLTKSFSQSLKIKMVDTQNLEIDIIRFELEEFPSMIVFENEKIYKKIYGENKIKDIIKGFNLDLNKSIDEA